ncbi:MAG: phosphotransferase [Candidatus Saccharimonadales bacterium]
MDDEAIEAIISKYGRQAVEIKPAQIGYRNHNYAFTDTNGNKCNLILYKREPGVLKQIKNANYVADYAAHYGLPARQTIDPRIIRLESSNSIGYGSLYNYLPGHTISWEAYTMEHIKLLGEAMANLHKAILPLKRHDLDLATENYHQLLARMTQYFNQPGVQESINQKLGLELDSSVWLYDNLLAELDRHDNQQPLHLDFVRGNILFSGTTKLKVSGILDFEKVAWGSPMLDIARTLAFLLVDCKYKRPTQVLKYFLQSGYIKRGGGKGVDKQLLQVMTNFFMLHDFYKFLLHNPYESLHQNEHYNRTQAFLLNRGLLVRTPKNARI